MRSSVSILEDTMKCINVESSGELSFARAPLRAGDNQRAQITTTGFGHCRDHGGDSECR
jgi:hypothetical protein